MLAYLMLLTALSNAVCIMLSSFFANAFCCHALSWFVNTVCLFQVLFSIMHSAFDLLVFPNLCSHHFLYERAMCSLGK